MQAWHTVWLAEVYRVLRPGGVIKAFSATRTMHRLAAAMRDVGFEVVRLEAWLYGSGFPKSLNVSKAIDAHLGGEREVIGMSATKSGISDANAGPQSRATDHAWARGVAVAAHYPVTTPATPDALRFDGYGTALKPSWEPFIVGRKPCSS
jgi:site-specific DNA-methyltransferase (adenine-specific)